MNSADYEFLASFLLATSGLALGPNKEYLLEARLLPLAHNAGLAGIPELVGVLKRNASPPLRRAAIEAMTTNETLFFRDRTPFEDLRDNLLPRLLEARRSQRRLRIWCAAASTGQEPYSIAMVIAESFPELANWNVEIIGTDLAAAPLKRAECGLYSQFEVQRGLPVQLLMKYFEQVETGWQVKRELRRKIRFQELNLLDDFSALGTFDIIFCRNVLIYFDAATKGGILERLALRLARDGYLSLGAAETVLGISRSFERFKECKSAIYLPAAPVPTTAR